MAAFFSWIVPGVFACQRSRRSCLALNCHEIAQCERFHGTRGGAPKGEANGSYKHGLHTQEASGDDGEHYSYAKARGTRCHFSCTEWYQFLFTRTLRRGHRTPHPARPSGRRWHGAELFKLQLPADEQSAVRAQRLRSALLDVCTHDSPSWNGFVKYLGIVAGGRQPGSRYIWSSAVSHLFLNRRGWAGCCATSISEKSEPVPD